MVVLDNLKVEVLAALIFAFVVHYHMVVRITDLILAVLSLEVGYRFTARTKSSMKLVFRSGLLRVRDLV